MENNEKETFTYTYSAQNREEIEAIRKKYLPAEEDKLDALRRLDKSASAPGQIISISLGVISTLVFGLGMSMVLTMTGRLFILGTLLGVIGLCGISAAKPVYNCITKKRREKIAPEIIRLTDEML